ncbi:MAG: DUF4397 domain-containing protein [Pyrinomonadaceae bacterium]
MNGNHRFSTTILMFLVAALVFATACNREESDNRSVTTTTNSGTTTALPASEAARRDNALVRVLNANNNIGTLDVYADDAKQFSAIAYKATTPYRELAGKSTEFKVRVAGMDSSPAIADESEGLDDGRDYTVIVVPGDDNRRSDIQVLEDDMKIPADGKARVRVVHAVREGDDFDIYATGKNDEVFEDVNFQEEDGYDDVDPYNGNLEVRPEGKSNALLTIQNARFEANKAYTLVIIGAINDGKPEMEAVIVEDKIGN